MKIVLAEDSTLLRAGLAGLLTAAGHEVTEVEDATALRQLCQPDNSPPIDLIVSDVRMPPNMSDDGLAAVHHIRQQHAKHSGTHVPVLILSQYVAAAYLDVLLDHGSFGYLLKERIADVDEFLSAVERIADGGTVVDPDVVKVLLNNRSSGINSLSNREQEVLSLMAEGYSNPEIEKKLFLSSGAVSKHVANVFMKLGFSPEDGNRRVRAVLLWLRHQEITPGA